MASVLVEARVHEGLERLRLRQMATVLESVCQQANTASRSYLEFLDRLLEAEQSAREERTVAMKTRLAHLPYRKRMADFDYSFQPCIDKQQIAELLTLRFLGAAENVLVLGPVAVGKTHITVARTQAAIAAGASAYFVTLHQLIEYLSEGTEPISSKLRLFVRPKLLVIDEASNLPLSREAADWVFELVSRRYKRGSMVLTFKKSSGEWGSIFPDVALASAILDRLLHHSR